LIGALIGAKKSNVRKRVGFFDTDDGFFFEQDGTDLKVVRRTFASGSPVDTAVNQSLWNLDPLDGTGLSGLSLDETDINTWVIEFDWTGGGKVKFGVKIDGNIIFVHEFFGNNVLTTPYTTVSTLPIRLELENTAAAGTATTIKLYAASIGNNAKCCCPKGIVRTIDMGKSKKTINSTLKPILSIRLKSANKKALIKAIIANVFPETPGFARIAVYFNASLTTPSFSSVGANSITEFDTAASAISGGTLLNSTYMVEGGGGGGGGGDDDDDNGGGGGGGCCKLSMGILKSELKLSSDIAGTADILTIAGEKISGTDPNVFVNLIFEELF